MSTIVISEHVCSINTSFPFTKNHEQLCCFVIAQPNIVETMLNNIVQTMMNKAATVHIFFGSVLIFDVGFRLFRFGSTNCILFVFHIQNMYS